MREIRLFHNRPQQNAQTLQNVQDPKVGATNKSTYRLTSSSDSFLWTPSLTEHMMQFLRFLKDNCKLLVVRLHGFSQNDENMMMWFQQACQWDLIVGIVANSLKSQALFICSAITKQCASPFRFLKINLYPADFNCTGAHNSLAQALQRSNCLNRLEIQLLNVGFYGGLHSMTRTISQGIGRNRSIRNLVLSGWDDTTWNYFFDDLADRDGIPLDQLILDKVGHATSDARNPVEWCRTLNVTKHIGFLSCKKSLTAYHCLYHLDSTALSHLQLTNAGWTSRQIDEFLVHFSQSCPNLSTLDLDSNRIEDLTFPQFSALVDSHVTPASSTHRRPLGSLKGFLLNGNPVLSDQKENGDKLRSNLYTLFKRIPSIVAILDSESKTKAKKEERAKLEKVEQCMRGLAIESPHLGIQLSPAAWPLLLSTTNRTLRSEPSLQAQAIYEFMVNASAVLSNEAAMDPIIGAATTSRSSVDYEPLWLSLQKLLSWS